MTTSASDSSRTVVFDPLAHSTSQIESTLQRLDLPGTSCHVNSQLKSLASLQSEKITWTKFTPRDIQTLFDTSNLISYEETIKKNVKLFSQISSLADYTIQKKDKNVFEIEYEVGEIVAFITTFRHAIGFDLVLTRKIESETNVEMYRENENEMLHYGNMNDDRYSYSHSGHITKSNNFLQYMYVNNNNNNSVTPCQGFLTIHAFNKKTLYDIRKEQPSVCIVNKKEKTLIIVPCPMDYKSVETHIVHVAMFSIDLRKKTICWTIPLEPIFHKGMFNVFDNSELSENYQLEEMKKRCATVKKHTTTQVFEKVVFEKMCSINEPKVKRLDLSDYQRPLGIVQINVESKFLQTSCILKPEYKFGRGLSLYYDNDNDDDTESGLVLPIAGGSVLYNSDLLEHGKLVKNEEVASSFRRRMTNSPAVIVVVGECVSQNHKVPPNLILESKLNAVFIVVGKNFTSKENLWNKLNGIDTSIALAMQGPLSVIFIELQGELYYYRGIENKKFGDKMTLEEFRRIVNQYRKMECARTPAATDRKVYDMHGRLVLVLSENNVTEEVMDLMFKSYLEKKSKETISWYLGQLECLLTSGELIQCTSALMNTINSRQTVLKSMISTLCNNLRSVEVASVLQELLKSASVEPGCDKIPYEHTILLECFNKSLEMTGEQENFQDHRYLWEICNEVHKSLNVDNNSEFIPCTSVLKSMILAVHENPYPVVASTFIELLKSVSNDPKCNQLPYEHTILLDCWKKSLEKTGNQENESLYLLKICKEVWKKSLNVNKNREWISQKLGVCVSAKSSYGVRSHDLTKILKKGTNASWTLDQDLDQDLNDFLKTRCTREGCLVLALDMKKMKEIWEEESKVQGVGEIEIENDSSLIREIGVESDFSLINYKFYSLDSELAPSHLDKTSKSFTLLFSFNKVEYIIIPLIDKMIDEVSSISALVSKNWRRDKAGDSEELFKIIFRNSVCEIIKSLAVEKEIKVSNPAVGRTGLRILVAALRALCKLGGGGRGMDSITYEWVDKKRCLFGMILSLMASGAYSPLMPSYAALFNSRPKYVKIKPSDRLIISGLMENFSHLALRETTALELCMPHLENNLRFNIERLVRKVRNSDKNFQINEKEHQLCILKFKTRWLQQVIEPLCVLLLKEDYPQLEVDLHSYRTSLLQKKLNELRSEGSRKIEKDLLKKKIKKLMRSGGPKDEKYLLQEQMKELKRKNTEYLKSSLCNIFSEESLELSPPAHENELESLLNDHFIEIVLKTIVNTSALKEMIKLAHEKEHNTWFISQIKTFLFRLNSKKDEVTIVNSLGECKNAAYNIFIRRCDIFSIYKAKMLKAVLVDKSEEGSLSVEVRDSFLNLCRKMKTYENKYWYYREKQWNNTSFLYKLELGFSQKNKIILKNVLVSDLGLGDGSNQKFHFTIDGSVNHIENDFSTRYTQQVRNRLLNKVKETPEYKAFTNWLKSIKNNYDENAELLMWC